VENDTALSSGLGGKNGCAGNSSCAELWRGHLTVEDKSDSRHHVYAKTSHKDVQLAEVGPRFEAKRELTLAHDVTLADVKPTKSSKGQSTKTRQTSNGC
jgi:hypothetical protein